MILHTYTGKKIDPANPKPEDFCIEDIAHALSNICRFSGNTSEFYSVAEHCVRATYLVEEQFKLETLLHDACEAYLGDVPTPVKRLCHGYMLIEDKFYKAIAERFGVPHRMTLEVQRADREMLKIESMELMSSFSISGPAYEIPPRRKNYSNKQMAKTYESFFTSFGGV